MTEFKEGDLIRLKELPTRPDHRHVIGRAGKVICVLRNYYEDGEDAVDVSFLSGELPNNITRISRWEKI